MTHLSVVIVEDDFLIGEDLKMMCEDAEIQVLDVLHIAEGAAERILSLAPDYVLMDVRLGGKRDGVDIAQAVHESSPTTRLIFVTGSNEPPTIARIKEDDPYDILIKPISEAALRKALGV